MLTRINFQSVPVHDQQRALEFYRDKLGMRVHTDMPYQGGLRWIFMEIPGSDTKVQFGGPDEVAYQPGVPVLCLVCDDTDVEAKRLVASGVTMSDGPADAPWDSHVRWAMFRDTEDNLILIQSSSLEGA
jgi:catechol 2,3-dioxygenase-like lactoylglutathione lyase family enzyme